MNHVGGETIRAREFGDAVKGTEGKVVPIA